MWRSRLFWRFFFSILAILLSTAVLSVYFERYLKRQNDAPHIEKTITELANFQAQLIHFLSQEDFDEVVTLLNAQVHYREQFLIFDRNGNEILGRDELLKPQFRSHFHRQLGKDFAQRGLSLYTEVISFGGNIFYIDVRPIMSFHPLLSPRLAGSLIRGFLLIIISVLVCYWLTRTLTRRIHLLQRATHQMALGEYQQVFPHAARLGHDELGQLGQDVALLAAQLNHAQNARRQMLSDISHELRSPLARLQVAVEIGKNQLEKHPEKTQKSLERIELESTRMEQLIAQIIQIQQLQLNKQQPLENALNIALIPLLQTVIADVHYEYQQYNKRIIIQSDNDKITVFAVAELLASALENILRNAMSHTPENSNVEITVSLVSQQVVITIKDAGEGVKQPDIERLFEPFVRLDSSRNRRTGGYGLGLALAKAVVNAHQGQLGVKNRSDQSGLMITVCLPAILT